MIRTGIGSEKKAGRRWWGLGRVCCPVLSHSFHCVFLTGRTLLLYELQCTLLWNGSENEEQELSIQVLFQCPALSTTWCMVGDDLRQRMGKWGIFHVGVGLLVPSNQFRQSSRKFSPVKGELRWKFRFERFSQIGQSNIFSLSTSWLGPLFTDTGQPRNVEHLFHKICSLWLSSV